MAEGSIAEEAKAINKSVILTIKKLVDITGKRNQCQIEWSEAHPI